MRFPRRAASFCRIDRRLWTWKQERVHTRAHTKNNAQITLLIRLLLVAVAPPSQIKLQLSAVSLFSVKCLNCYQTDRRIEVRTRDDTEREKARVKRTTFAARLNVPATAWPPFWPSSSRDQRQRSALKASTSQSTSTLALHTSYVYRLLLLLLLGQQLLLPFSFARSFEQASLWRHSLLSVVMPQQVDERICRHCTPFDVWSLFLSLCLLLPPAGIEIHFCVFIWVANI